MRGKLPATETMGALVAQYKSSGVHERIDALAGGIWRLRLPMRFNPGHINSYLLPDGDSWVVVDCGNHSEETRAVWSEVLAECLDGRPVSRIILTHAHPDHYGSAPWLLGQTGSRLLLASAEWSAVNRLWRGSAHRPAELADFFFRRGVPQDAVSSIQRFMEGFESGCPPCQCQPDFVEPGECLNIGGQRWRLLGGYGHTPCNLLLLRESDGVVITGDQVLPTITPNVSLWFDSDEDPLGSMLDTLARLQTVDVTLALPAHGDPFTDFAARCDAMTRTYRRRLQRVRKRLQAGAADLAQLSEAGFGKTADGPLFMLVAGQLLALLAHLQARGEAVFDGERYRLSDQQLA